MTTDLAAARTLLAEWPNLPPAHDRFSAALHQVQGSTGHSDLAVLIRQVLRTSDATRQEGAEAQLRRSTLPVPVDVFPADFDFDSYGLISSSAGGQIALEASPWQPSWLPDASWSLRTKPHPTTGLMVSGQPSAAPCFSVQETRCS
jgi:hypothetical protein